MHTDRRDHRPQGTRRHPSAGRTWTRTGVGEPATVPLLRRAFVHWLDGRGVAAGGCERAELVVSELVSNAVEAAPGHTLRVDGTDDGQAVVVTVTNRSDGDRCPPPPDQWTGRAPDARRGRGLAIVRALADEVTVARPDRTSVAVTTRLVLERR